MGCGRSRRLRPSLPEAAAAGGRRRPWLPWVIAAAAVLVVGGGGGGVAGIRVGISGGGSTPSTQANSSPATPFHNSSGAAPTTPPAPPPTTTTTMSAAQYQASCTTTMTFGQLSSPNAPQGTCITGQAQVFQFDSNTGPTSMLIDVTNDGCGDWYNVVELQLPNARQDRTSSRTTSFSIGDLSREPTPTRQRLGDRTRCRSSRRLT